MAAKRYSLLAICVILVTQVDCRSSISRSTTRPPATDSGTQSAAADSSTRLPTIDSSTTGLPVNISSNTSYNDFPDRKVQHKPKKLTKCYKAFCYRGQCDDVKGKGAVCSCPDPRMYLAVDNRTCKKRLCNQRNPARSYTCGSGAYCNMLDYDVKLRLMMPQCVCKRKSFLTPQLTLDLASRSCSRDTQFQTCDWPKDSGCSQGCKQVFLSSGTGSRPQCICDDGYKLDGSGTKCIVSNPCIAGGRNGGCEQNCDFNRQTLDVTCSCRADFTLSRDGKKCEVKNCNNGNSNCQQGCIQIDSRNYYCTCNKGYQLQGNKKSCFDYDECAGFHGCDQNCVPTDNGWYTCSCNPGYYLDDDGYSCRVSDKCINHGCSQHCSSTTGACYCDPTHELSRDGKTCIDIDECAKGTNDCQQKCLNTEGGYSCECNDPRARLSNDLKTCVLDKCEELNDILNGAVTCQRSHSDNIMKVGDYCTFSCNAGNQLVGYNIVRCTISGYDYVPPHCADTNECNTPNRCGENELCTNTLGSFACVCKNGFRRQNGKCTDKTGPRVLSCPSDATLQLPDDSDTVTHTWLKPRVFDATDPLVSCVECPSSEEKTMGVGVAAITYLYRDKAGNVALCLFKIKVIDVTPPIFENCPNGTVFERGPGAYDISTFAQVSATDNSGQVTLSHDEPPQFLNPGQRAVNYQAKDDSGNHATCTFYVNIVVNICPELSAPENGVNGCTDWNVGTFCQPRCNEGFAFYNQLSTDKYHCTTEGTWSPAGVLPKCYPTVTSEEAVIKYVSRYKAKCPMDDPATLKQVILVATNSFNENREVFCYIGDSCNNPAGPQVECNGDYFTVSWTTDEDFTKVSEFSTMLVDFKTKIKAQLIKTPALMSLIFPPFTIVTPLAGSNGLPVTPKFILQCPNDSKGVGNKCVTCPAGESC